MQGSVVTTEASRLGISVGWSPEPMAWGGGLLAGGDKVPPGPRRAATTADLDRARNRPASCGSCSAARMGGFAEASRLRASDCFGRGQLSESLTRGQCGCDRFVSRIARTAMVAPSPPNGQGPRRRATPVGLGRRSRAAAGRSPSTGLCRDRSSIPTAIARRAVATRSRRRQRGRCARSCSLRCGGDCVGRSSSRGSRPDPLGRFANRSSSPSFRTVARSLRRSARVIQ